MSAEYDAAIEICGAVELVRKELDYIGNRLNKMDDLPDLRDQFAMAALQGLRSASYGEYGYVPSKVDSDFTQNDNGDWSKTKFGWSAGANACGVAKAERFSLVATMEDRFAHDAFAYADAMVAARQKIKVNGE